MDFNLRHFQCYLETATRHSREETGLLACAVMYRALLNALDSGHSQDCWSFSLCEARKQVDTLGTVGATIGRLAENKANTLLGLVGRDYDTESQDCLDIFPCANLPAHYKDPAI